MKGLINLNKPTGISSAAAVSKVRRFLGVRAVGHMGTLDPLASGVLLVGVGKACRLFDFFLKKDKKYTAVFEFGCETDTLDSTGTYSVQNAYVPTIAEIQAVLGKVTGKLEQIPPQYSAKSVNGQRAYKVARSGGTVELKSAAVEVFDIALNRQLSHSSFEFNIHCSSGTYIRSIARDIAYELDTHAIMTALIRTKCGQYELSNSVELAELEARRGECLITLDNVLLGMPRLDLTEKYHKLLENGVKIPFDASEHVLVDCSGNSVEFGEQPFTVYANGELFGIANKNSDGYLRITTYLKD